MSDIFSLTTVDTTLNGAATLIGTSSLAITASYAIAGGSNSGGSGTNLFTASTYQITSSWATHALTASRLEAASVVIGADNNITGANNVTGSGKAAFNVVNANNLAIPGGSLLASNAGGDIVAITSGSTLSYTASYAQNIAGAVSSASYASTASLLSNYQTYVTDTTSSNNAATFSFAVPNHQLNLTVAKLYTFTSSNNPSAAGQCADITIFVSHSVNATSSLSFPASWQNVGGSWPSAITSSAVATLWLRAVDTNQVIGTWISNR